MRVLAPLQSGEAKDFIERFNAGIVVESRNVDDIASSLVGEIRAWE